MQPYSDPFEAFEAMFEQMRRQLDAQSRSPGADLGVGAGVGLRSPDGRRSIDDGRPMDGDGRRQERTDAARAIDSPNVGSPQWLDSWSRQYGMPGIVGQGRQQLDAGRTMAIDVADRDDSYEITVDVPGFDRENVTVSLDEQTLTITARESTADETQQDSYVQKERSYETLSRSLTLPENSDRDAITASMNKGVLTITVPKVDGSDDGTEIEIDGN